MNRFLLSWLLAAGLCTAARAQQDTVRLKEAEVRSYFRERSLLQTPASIGLITAADLQKQPDYSLVNAVNTVPGVRMEERSPGSYRLSIRGSLLRSPFGIRNIKMYLDDFPLTDAGGNSYLNSIDAGNINRLEILKGPDASVFGANSGGVVIINPVPQKADSGYALAGASGGSFGLLHQKFAVQEAFSRYRFNFTQAFQRSDGYRDHSAFKRHYVQWFQQINYASPAQLKVLFLYSKLDYQTPGGLTQEQFRQNHRAARPGTAMLPGAEVQKASVYNRTIYGGLSHQLLFTSYFRHVLTVFGSNTDFENPFITNYETRKETSFGTRTYLELSSNEQAPVSVKWQTGLEAQQTRSLITNYGNRGGNRDTLQARDNLHALSHFYFTRIAASVYRKLTIEAAASLNFYAYDFRNRFPQANSGFSEVRFSPQLMPRIAASYALSRNTALRASVSRGYSAPTIAEVRSSDLVINTALEPETGWNYETGIRVYNAGRWFFADASVYYFRLEQAIVRRLNDGGNEYFINAGGTNQAGAEVQLNVSLMRPRETGLLRSMELHNAFTFNRFLFRDYADAQASYTNNLLTGTPQYVNVAGLTTRWIYGLSLYMQYNYTGPIPLNDGNSVFAPEYHLLQARIGYRLRLRSLAIELFAGADNLLNETYSLGNDLNAFGGRYYNAAASRNYYAGLNLIL